MALCFRRNSNSPDPRWEFHGLDWEGKKIRDKKKPAYSAAAKILHYMALNSPLIGEMAFDIEQGLFLESSPQPKSDRHVFVSGLARAGTTVLMWEVYKSNEFASLTYADMPFVLCPNLWSKAVGFSQKIGPARERAHGDGLYIDYHSPEAFEEVFWRVFAGDEFIKSDGLYPHKPDSEVVSHFKAYIRLVLRNRNKERYLSKNNNNILRIPTLRREFNDAVFLIPIRHPLQHSHSLLAQHQRFSKGDRFTRRYMDWLGHHEFGATHKPFVFSSDYPRCEERFCLDYWLEQWVNCYSYLCQITGLNQEGVYFVPYESLCGVPAVWGKISEIIGVDGSRKTEFKESRKAIKEVPGSQLMEIAVNLYSEIKGKALDALGVDT
jgi:hypothetical protein